MSLFVPKKEINLTLYKFYNFLSYNILKKNNEMIFLRFTVLFIVTLLGKNQISSRKEAQIVAQIEIVISIGISPHILIVIQQNSSIFY